MNTARALIWRMVLQTSAISFWWKQVHLVLKTESWNGTNWTEVNDLNQAKKAVGGAGTDNKCIKLWWIYQDLTLACNRILEWN